MHKQEQENLNFFFRKCNKVMFNDLQYPNFDPNAKNTIYICLLPQTGGRGSTENKCCSQQLSPTLLIKQIVNIVLQY